MSDPLLRLVPPRRPRRGRTALLVLLLCGTAAAGAVAVVGLPEAADAPAPSSTVPAPVGDGDEVAAAAPALPAATDEARAAALEPRADLAPLGVAAGLPLFVPGLDPVVVSYHEASFPEALAIAPAGVLVLDENATRTFDRSGPDGPEYRVQVSRGRRQGPTTAVDVVLDEGTQVLSPLRGTVTEVRPYELYGVHEDVRLELRPDDRPELRVVMIHVEGVEVAPGDRVEVGDVLAAGARLFPFEAVVDRATAPARHGHVHLEVKRPAQSDEESSG